MYLTRVVLENFQAFEKGEFNLSPNLNVLVGVSNVGKSSVARALSLLLFNQWDRSWVRFGSKHCRVLVQTSTGIEVIREKGDKVNRYILTLPGCTPQTFEAFGTGVPEQIQQALNIHTVQVDNTDTLNLNLASQMDSLFLLSQTGSYRAKVFGKLSGATYLDHAIRALNIDKRHVTAARVTAEENLGNLKIEVDKIQQVESYGPILKTLEERVKRLKDSRDRLESIRMFLEAKRSLKDRWTQEEQKSVILSRVDLNLVKQLEKRVDKIKEYSLLLNKKVNNTLSMVRENKLKTILGGYKGLDVTTIEKHVISNNMLRELFVKYRNSMVEIPRLQAQGLEFEKQLNTARQEHTDCLISHGFCPTCNQKTDRLCLVS